MPGHARANFCRTQALRRAVESHIEARLVAMQREVRLEVGADRAAWDVVDCHEMP